MQDLSNYEAAFRQIGFPEEEAHALLMRLQLIKQINQEIERRKWSQRKAAEYLGVAQPRIAELGGLRVDKFSMDLLVKYLHRLGRKVSVAVR